MEQIRKEQLSIYYWLRNLFPDFVNIKDEYPDDALMLPVISIITDEVNPVPFELGGKDQDNRFWHIYIYANSAAQRDDFGSRILESLGNGVIPVYNYDEGFPPPNPTQIGSLLVRSRSYKPLRVFEELVYKKYWWGVVDLYTYFDPAV